jgi:hypothetical protein
MKTLHAGQHITLTGVVRTGVVKTLQIKQSNSLLCFDNAKEVAPRMDLTAQELKSALNPCDGVKPAHATGRGIGMYYCNY